jgi:hypothetical protein
MPRGDGTGPMGTGPMSGRQAGYCADFDAPGYANPAPRLGLARGFGGGGRGWRHWFYATGLPRWARGSFAPPTPQQEADALKEKAGWLKDQLDAINKRIEEIEQK